MYVNEREDVITGIVERSGGRVVHDTVKRYFLRAMYVSCRRATEKDIATTTRVFCRLIKHYYVIYNLLSYLTRHITSLVI
jgi:hypothetical protein